MKMAIKMKFFHFDFSICAANSDTYFTYFLRATIIGQAAMLRRMATSSICSVGGRATRARGQRASIGVRLVDGLALYLTYECIG